MTVDFQKNQLPLLLNVDKQVFLDGQIRSEQLFSNDKNIFIVAHRMYEPAPLHQHNFYEFVFVNDGRVINQTLDDRIYLLANSLLIMNLHSQHALEVVDSNALVINIGVNQSLFQQGLFKQFLQDVNPLSQFLQGSGTKKYLYFPTFHQLEIWDFLNQIIQEYCQSNFQNTYKLYGYFLLLLADISQEIHYSFKGIDHRSMQIINYIEQNYATVNVQQLARQFNFSASYLSRYVKQHTGWNISELIVTTKLEQAKERLLKTEATIEEIAREVGYQSTSYFYKLFKKKEGHSPQEYREMNR